MREPEGFRDFVTYETPRLLRSACLLTHDWHAAEDLVQTALINALPRWGRIDNHVAYVRTTMLRTYLKGRERRWTGELPTENLPEHGTGLFGAASDLRVDLVAALDRLPRQQRAVIVLRFFDDLTEAQTADALGCAVGTVKSHTHRALAALRQQPGLQSLIDPVREEVGA